MKRTILIPLLLSTFLLVGYAEKDDVFILQCTDYYDDTYSEAWTFNQTSKEANGYPYESPFGDEGTIWFWEDASKNEFALFDRDSLIVTYTDGDKRFFVCEDAEEN